MACLSLSDISFCLGKWDILKEISLTLSTGEWVGILGPNGAGKSTLLKIMAGLLQPNAGQRSLNKIPYPQWSKTLYQWIAYLPQVNTYPIPFSVQDIVSMGRHPFKKNFESLTRSDLRCTASALRQTTAWAWRHRPITELSGGETQLVSLARILAQDTPFFILDEPFSNLDMRHEYEMGEALNRFKKKGHGIVTVLHHLSFLPLWIDRLIVINQGEVVTSGTPNNVLDQPLFYETFGLPSSVRSSLRLQGNKR